MKRLLSYTRINGIIKKRWVDNEGVLVEYKIDEMGNKIIGSA